VPAPEEQLRRRLREISSASPRYGYRRAWGLLRMEGWMVNRKRVQRLWRDEGLRVPSWTPKRRRLGESTVPAARLRAERQAARREVGMHHHPRVFVIVEAGAPELAVVHAKPQRLDQVQVDPGIGRQADDVPRIGRDLGVDEDNGEHRGDSL